MAQRPPHAGPDGGVVVRVREHPLRRPLEHGEAVRRSERWSGAIWNPLAPAPIMATRLPVRSTSWSHRAEWNAGPAKVSAPSMAGTFGSVELADGGDHRPGRQDLLGPVGRTRARTDHVADSSSQVAPSTSVSQRTWAPIPCLSHDRLEVALELGLPGEVLGPVVARLEAVAVEVVADVDPGPGIRVLPPGSAHAGVLLDDGEGDAGLLQPDRRPAVRTARTR